MTRNRRLAFGAIVVGTLAVAAASFSGVFSSKPAYVFAGLKLRPSIELRSEAPDECWRLSRRNIAGVVVAAQPEQCNGDAGQVTFQPGTNKLATQVFTFKHSERVRFLAEYAPDGAQIVKGFALRDDGSMLWQAVPDFTGITTTTTYWWNGNVFSIEKRAAGKSEVDVTYFRSTNKPWMHYIGRAGIKFEQARMLQVYGMRSVELFDEDGNKRVDGVVAANNRGIEYTFLRANGTVSHKQSWAFYTTGGGMEGGGEAIGVKTLKIFAADGRLAREVSKEGVNSVGIVDYQVNGARTEYVLNPNATIRHVTKYNPKGDKVLDVDATAQAKVDPEEDFKFEALPEALNPEPAAVWAEQEKLHHRRTVVQ